MSRGEPRNIALKRCEAYVRGYCAVPVRGSRQTPAETAMHKKNPEKTTRISVIVPTRNQGTYLGACLDALWFQDYPELEILLVDNASTDNTPEVATALQHAVNQEKVSYASYYDEQTNAIERVWHARYPAHGRTFAAHRLEQPVDFARAVQYGLAKATGALHCVLRANVLCYPQLLSTLAKPLLNGEADTTFADAFLCDAQGRILRELPAHDTTTFALNGPASLPAPGPDDAPPALFLRKAHTTNTIDPTRQQHVPMTLCVVRIE
ncbi:Glycosyl transferase family 2 [Paucidesulfovibrio gracilis DSM 16080]|uniref:Glycosyl transferase family 2 n=2 Tax=Paucidesulfovibrio TaxID=2910985 RepID=A0A1T4Y7H3_9BACT|nr:Glycosyl transferase family 2 [Paucidesulfovibrio gracilis DSM 16080]